MARSIIRASWVIDALHVSGLSTCVQWMRCQLHAWLQQTPISALIHGSRGISICRGGLQQVLVEVEELALLTILVPSLLKGYCQMPKTPLQATLHAPGTCLAAGESCAQSASLHYVYIYERLCCPTSVIWLLPTVHNRTALHTGWHVTNLWGCTNNTSCTQA